MAGDPIQKKRRLPLYVPWMLVYLVLVGGGAVTSAAITYEKYDVHRLPTGHITLSLDNTHYELGERITFTIENHFPVPVFVTNQCPNEPLNVYRWEENHWVQLHASAPSDAECYGEDRNVAIPEEGSRSYHFDDWSAMFERPGVYRIAAVLAHYQDVPFQDFVIMEEQKVVVVEEHVPAKTKPTPVVSVPAAVPVPVIPPPVTPVVEEPPVVEEEPEYENEEDDDRHEREEEEDDD